MVEWVAAGILVVVGIIHSALGEVGLVSPLLADRGWSVRMPRRVAERIFRFAWHLTTIAWWALAAVLVGVRPAVAFAVTCLVSAVVVMVVVPGFVAWPFFTAAGVLALWAGGAIPVVVLRVAVVVAVAGALVAAGLHLAWAVGVRRGLVDAVPQDPRTGAPLRVPGRLACLAVAVALAVLGAVLVAVAAGAGPRLVRWAAMVALALLTARVLGDGRWVGVFKRVRGTDFARADDRYYTPAVATLALGTLAALAL